MLKLRSYDHFCILLFAICTRLITQFQQGKLPKDLTYSKCQWQMGAINILDIMVHSRPTKYYKQKQYTGNFKSINNEWCGVITNILQLYDKQTTSNNLATINFNQKTRGVLYPKSTVNNWCMWGGGVVGRRWINIIALF